MKEASSSFSVDKPDNLDGSDVTKAMKLLKEATTEHKGVLKFPESFVAFESFGDNSSY